MGGASHCKGQDRQKAMIFLSLRLAPKRRSRPAREFCHPPELIFPGLNREARDLNHVKTGLCERLAQCGFRPPADMMRWGVEHQVRHARDIAVGIRHADHHAPLWCQALRHLGQEGVRIVDMFQNLKGSDQVRGSKVFGLQPVRHHIRAQIPPALTRRLYRGGILFQSDIVSVGQISGKIAIARPDIQNKIAGLNSRRRMYMFQLAIRVIPFEPPQCLIEGCIAQNAGQEIQTSGVGIRAQLDLVYAVKQVRDIHTKILLPGLD